MKRSGRPERRTPLKQGTKGLKRSPLRSGDRSLVRGDGPKRTPIRQRSAKRSEFMRDVRAPAVAALVARGERCRIGPLLADAGLGEPCGIVVQGLHERRKRSAGGSLTNPANLIPACNVCNGWVEDFPKLAREVFGDLLVVREGDPEWESLGTRNDKA
jgi:hypothetical protein